LPNQHGKVPLAHDRIADDETRKAMDADGPGTMITYAAKRVSTRDLLLDAAFDLFAEIGFAGTTISQIERRVGLAAGSG
jgi:AcrR family transcriptional regulator